MDESFLKEQLERIRKLTERVTAFETNASELSHAMAHDREALQQGPLHQVRDYRLYRPENPAPEPETPPRPSESRDTSRPRRRG